MNRERPQFMQQPSFNQPVSVQSQSEVKPPTINSSFFPNFHSYQDWGSPQPDSKDDNFQCVIHEASPQICKKYKKNSKQSEARSPELSGRQVQQHIIKFIDVLIRKAYVYRETLFNSLQKTIMTEKYIKFEISESCQDYLMIWDFLYLILIIYLLFWQPMQLGFLLDNNITCSLIFIPIMISDITIGYQYNKGKTQYFRCSQLNKTDVLNLISYSLLLGTNIFDLGIIIIAHISNFFCSLIKLQSTLKKYSINFSFTLSIPILVFQLLAFIHFSACFWLLLGNNYQRSWIEILNLQEESNLTKYFYSLNWATASVLNIGQSQINPSTQQELLFSSLIMFISGWVLAQLIAIVLNNQEENNLNQSKELIKINEFFKTRKLSMKTKNNLLNYFITKGSSKIQLDQILSKVPKHLGDELCLQIGGQFLHKCLFLNNFSENTRSNLISTIKFKKYYKNEIIDKTEKQLNLIDFGRINILEYDQSVQQLQAGDSFGQLSFISEDLCSSQFQMAEDTGMFQIAYTDFLKVIQQNMLDYEKFLFIKDSILNGNYKILNIKCYSCQSYSHLIKDCPVLAYKPNLIRLIQKANKAQQQRVNFMRNQNQRSQNQVFKQLNLNLSCIDILQAKMKVIQPKDSSEENLTEEEVANQILEELGDQMRSDQFNKKLNDGKNEATIFLTQNIDQRLLEDKAIENQQFRQQVTVGTAQFQIEKETQKMLLQSQSHKLQNKGVIVNPFEKIQPDNSLSQLESGSQSCLSNEDQSYRKKTKRISKENLKQKQNDSIESMKPYLMKIKEEDSFLVNQMPYNQEDIMIPKLEQFSQPSLKSKNIQTNQQQRQSLRRFSTKISSIQYNNSEKIRPSKQKLSYFAQNQLLLIPTSKGMVDLSLFNNNEESKEVFETMHSFTIYYPAWNYTQIIIRVNQTQSSKLYYKHKP